jgi:hypothetical protein
MLHLLVVWGLGFTISCGVGHFAVAIFLRWLSGLLEVPRDDDAKRTPPWLTGLLERIFFTLAVAVNATGVLPAMIAWLALKLVANWQHRENLKDPAKTNYKFSAIVSGLLSMLFAYIGGLVIWHWS